MKISFWLAMMIGAAGVTLIVYNQMWVGLAMLCFAGLALS